MTATTTPGSASVGTSSRLMWAILDWCCSPTALDMIDSTVTNIAAPTIAHELHGGPG